MKNLLFIIVLFLLLHSCISEWDKALDKKNLKNTWLYNKGWLNKNNCKFDPFIYNSNFEINVELKGTRRLWEDSLLDDSVSNIKLYFRFYNAKGDIIKVPAAFVANNLFKKYCGKGNFLQVPIEVNFQNAFIKTQVTIPFILFKDMPSGENIIYVELYGTKYYQKEQFSEEVLVNGLKARWKLTFTMPEVYETILYTGGIFLQNDDKFSPVGMDFSFRLGLPDIYWTVFVPAKNKEDFSNYYWRSGEATYSMNYIDSDTVAIYTLSPKEKFIIGVYDRDDFSHDDFIGDWFGKLNELYSDTFKSIKFDHIDKLMIKATFNGCINQSEKTINR
ncbi:MAG TPA: hypothetical protein PLP65_04465 [Bacteroidales bacterium]|nr:hypothetical protein [Bacteroidales bacterium]